MMIFGIWGPRVSCSGYVFPPQKGKHILSWSLLFCCQCLWTPADPQWPVLWVESRGAHFAVQSLLGHQNHSHRSPSFSVLIFLSLLILSEHWSLAVFFRVSHSLWVSEQPFHSSFLDFVRSGKSVPAILRLFHIVPYNSSNKY